MSSTARMIGSMADFVPITGYKFFRKPPKDNNVTNYFNPFKNYNFDDFQDAANGSPRV